MQANADELDLSPPPPRWDWRAWLLALVAHALLIAALAWGIGWRRDTPAVASAELWASVPTVAAPRAAEPPPAPPAAPAPPQPSAPPAASQPRPADIGVQRQREEPRRREDEARRPMRERSERQQDEQQQRAPVQAERERQAREQAARQQAAREAQQRQLQAQLEAERRGNLERILGQAAASGGAQARGSDPHDAGPSASYAARVVAAIRPNIVFTDSVPGNPRAEVEVRTLPDGTIVSSRLLRSSGQRAWDDAVLRAIERTGRLPRDVDGRVPATLILGFRPQE